MKENYLNLEIYKEDKSKLERICGVVTAYMGGSNTETKLVAFIPESKIAQSSCLNCVYSEPECSFDQKKQARVIFFEQKCLTKDNPTSNCKVEGIEDFELIGEESFIDLLAE